MNKHRRGAELFPPPMIPELDWDILLALYADRHECLDVQQLACLVSASPPALKRSLGRLERHGLVDFRSHFAGAQQVPALSRDGGQLLDRYLSAANELQAGQALTRPLNH